MILQDTQDCIQQACRQTDRQTSSRQAEKEGGWHADRWRTGQVGGNTTRQADR